MYLEQDKHIEVVGTTDLESGCILLQVGPESLMFSFIFGTTYNRTAAYLYYVALKLTLRRESIWEQNTCRSISDFEVRCKRRVKKIT